jgi:hypothetical protein
MGEFEQIVNSLAEEFKILSNVFLAGRWYPFLLLHRDFGILVVRPIQYQDWQYAVGSSGKVLWRQNGCDYKVSLPSSILREQCCYLSYWLQAVDTRWRQKMVPFHTLPPVRGLFFAENLPGDKDDASAINDILGNFQSSSQAHWRNLSNQGRSALVSFIVNLPPILSGAQEIRPEDLDRWHGHLAGKVDSEEFSSRERSAIRKEEGIARQNLRFRSISLSGFKIYSEERTLAFRPITILLGKNNSGKSTIIQALLLLKQSLEKPLESGPLRFHGPYWDLGNFENCRSRDKSNEPIQLRLAFENALGQERAFNFRFEMAATQPALTELAYYETPLSDGDEKSEIPLYTFKRDSTATREGNKRLLLAEIAFEHPLWRRRISELEKEKNSGNIHSDVNLEDSALKRLLTSGGTAVMAELKAFLPMQPTAVDSGYANDSLSSALYATLFRELEKLSQAVSSFLANIVYIGPNRPFIKRFYSADKLHTEEDQQNWDMFNKVLNDSGVEAKVNEWLKNFDIDHQSYVVKGPLFGTDVLLPRLWPKWKPGNPKEKVKDFNTDSQDTALLSFGDVGQGVTHLFPIIVKLLTATESFIIIEEPELHIHPALQTCLGDLFIASAQKNRNVIFVESHSEYIIDRLMRRIAEEKINNNEEVAIYYLRGNNKEKSPIPNFQPLLLDKYGLFQNKIPEDFFNAGTDEGKLQLEKILERKRGK